MSNFEKPLTALLKAYNLTEDDINMIREKLKPKKILKGECFLEAGKMCNEIGILFSGLLYARFEKSNGEESVSRFFYLPQNFIVTNFKSFVKGEKSIETIKALEDSMLFIIEKKDLDVLYTKVPAMNELGRKLAEDSYINTLERLRMLQAMNGEERVSAFLKENSVILGKVSNWQIASYLGMTRNNFDNIRKKMRR